MMRLFAANSSLAEWSVRLWAECCPRASIFKYPILFVCGLGPMNGAIVKLTASPVGAFEISSLNWAV